MRSFCRLLAILVLTISLAYKTLATNVTFVPQHWRNTNMLRTIDLTSSIVRETTSVAAQNIHNESIGEYYFPIPEQWDNHLSYIEVRERKTKQTFEVEKVKINPLKWVPYSNQLSRQFDDMFVMQRNEKNEIICGSSKKFKLPLLHSNDTTSTCSRIRYYKIFFNRRLDPQEQIKFTITTAFTHMLIPYPKEITQTGRQQLLFQGNQYGNSAYQTDQQKTNVKLPSADIISYSQTKGNVIRNQKNLDYGRFNETKPNSYEELRIHYEFQQNMLTVTGLRRDLEISHWGGNLAVEEHFNLTHDGARLKGHFSRLDYHKTVYIHHETIMTRELTLSLPIHVSDVYYRDEIGNVSTSNLRYEQDKTIFDFKPRYPLFGGWNYTWYYGYNVPLGDFVRYHYESGRYILNIPFVNVFPQAIHDKVQVRIILPEGASDVKVETPFVIDKETHGVHKTYLDTIGRYLIVLEKSNVVNDHSKNIQISYTYSSLELLRKPLSVSLFLLGPFLLSMIYSRIEFSIGKSKRKTS
ncbi:11419_t:CDS:2 [Funneliformis caledonium]|uniref:Dolichyl-diphosphooligosaccharide--protein glycosyltransferase subunit 1 n=1 Tax=Funneliformis caledonium TaxID=1117310 RepID=A0A9N8ZIN5_9GLOM|nr:11419_t:CDS:2 [Funneliformis caledonium]